MDTKEAIHSMKKVVLHLHLDGSLRPETVQNWFREDGEFVKIKDVREKLSVSKDCKNLNEYLEKFEIPLRFLQTDEKIKKATFEVFEDLAKRNVIYAEVRFAPILHLQNGLSQKQVVESAISGMKEAKEKYGIEGGLILCCVRGEHNELANEETVKTAKKYLANGVCAIDLAGSEGDYPTKDYKNIFDLAKENKIPFTIHAGEADGPESIRTALKFGALRIGHGVRCLEDKELIKKLKSKGTLLEICPTSNIQTCAVKLKKNAKYPIETIYNSGINVELNTDNDTVSNTNIEQEYEWVLNNTSLTLEDLKRMNVASIRAAFTTDKIKKALEKQIL